MFNKGTKYFVSYTFTQKINNWKSANELNIFFKRDFGSSIIEVKSGGNLDEFTQEMRKRLDTEDLIILFFKEVN